MGYEPMILATERAAGKTTQALRWMLGGVETDGYPGWTRVLVVPTMRMKMHLRRRLWLDVEDIDHRLYSWHEWENAHGVNHDTEVLIDEINSLLPRVPGNLVGFTITAQPWDSLPEVTVTATKPIQVTI